MPCAAEFASQNFPVTREAPYMKNETEYQYLLSSRKSNLKVYHHNCLETTALLYVQSCAQKQYLLQSLILVFSPPSQNTRSNTSHPENHEKKNSECFI